MKILVTPTSFKPDVETEALKKLRAFSGDLVFNTKGRPLEEDELIEQLADCDGYLAGLDYVTAKVIESCPKLKVISRYGIGYDRVDIPAATARDIVVTNTPGANSEAVGELAFSMILAAARKLTYLDAQTRADKWVRSTGTEIRGKTLGVVGLGSIGKVVARCAGGFDMKVISYDPFINEDYCRGKGIGVKTFDELIEEADVISFHLPLNDDTRHMVNGESIARMKPGVILINTSRGGIIDEQAVYEALKDGRVGGLGLDAFEQEPPKGSPLFELDNVVVTPHTGAHTAQATANMANMAVDNLIAALSGENVRFRVNK